MTKQKKFKFGPLQKKWLKALKSGEYKKATGGLTDINGGYCCLGVANEVCKLGQGKEAGSLYSTYQKLGLKASWGEFDETYTFPRGTKTYDSLAEMNDCGISHKKIADFIEKNPELVFTESV